MKKTIRAQILKQRDLLLEEEMQDASRDIIRQIESMDAYKKAKTVTLYQPMKNEVNLLYLKGKQFCFPKVFGKDLIFFSDNDFERGAFNVMEPIGKEPVDKKDIDIVFVPLVAVDKNNNRIGYGKGFYDRYLKDYKGLKVGIGYEFQAVENIDVEIHDVSLDMVLLGKTK